MSTLDDFLAAMQAETDAERAEQLRKMLVAGNRILFATDVWAALTRHFGIPPETERFELFGMVFEVAVYVPAGMMFSMPNRSALDWLVPLSYVDNFGELIRNTKAEDERAIDAMARSLGIPRHFVEGRT